MILGVALLLGAPAAAQTPYPPGAPSLTLTPSTVDPGGSFTATFSGCTAGETVNFTLAGATTTATCTSQSTATGANDGAAGSGLVHRHCDGCHQPSDRIGDSHRQGGGGGRRCAPDHGLRQRSDVVDRGQCDRRRSRPGRGGMATTSGHDDCLIAIDQSILAGWGGSGVPQQIE